MHTHTCTVNSWLTITHCSLYIMRLKEAGIVGLNVVIYKSEGQSFDPNTCSQHAEVSLGEKPNPNVLL